MSFRRQDIPKTSRKTGEGERRRVYPRFLRDGALLPRIALMIEYLDGMVGRKRGDLEADAVLDLIGDAKLARCLLSCLSSAYRYRPTSLADHFGDRAAARLAGHDIRTPVDLRQRVFLHASDRFGGAVAAERTLVLDEVAGELGMDAAQLDTGLFLDAERHHTLVRFGQRPSPEDVLARYNALLVVSVLRHASAVTLTLPGIDRRLVDALSDRYDVPIAWTGADEITIRGRRGENGTWSAFGSRIARVVAHLLVAAPAGADGAATVHLNGGGAVFVIDDKVTRFLRPKARIAADAEGVVVARELVEGIAAHRKTEARFAGWTVRRALEPLVTAAGVLLPELTLTRDDLAVPVVALDDTPSPATLALLAALDARQPVVAVRRFGPLLAVPASCTAAVGAVADRLDAMVAGGPRAMDARARLRATLDERRWLAWHDLVGLAGDERSVGSLIDGASLASSVAPLPGIGVFRSGDLDALRRAASGPGAITNLRRHALALTGEPAAADALTLAVLTRLEDEATDRAA